MVKQKDRSSSGTAESKKHQGNNRCPFVVRVLAASLGLMLIFGPLSLLTGTGDVQAYIGFDAASVSPGSGEGTSISWSHTVGTGGANRILVVGVSWRNYAANTWTVASVTYNGQGLTEIRMDEKYDSESRCSALYYLVDPPTGVAHDVQVNFTGSIYRAVGGAVSLTGVDQSNPVDAHNGVAGATGSTASVTVTTKTAGAWLVDTLCVRNPDGTTTNVAPQDERWNRRTDSTYGIDGAGSTVGPAAAIGDTTMSWSLGASLPYSMSAAAFRPYSNAIYYSVGTQSASLYAGNASANGGILTLLSGAADDNIGVGDEVRVGTSRYYIKARNSSTEFAIQNSAASGGTPGATNITFSSQSITIYRAFNSLSAAVAYSDDSSHLATGNLVTGNYQLNWSCYADGADSSSGVWISSADWTTSTDNYIKIYTPVGTDEVGTSQRHNGVYSTSAYRFEYAPSWDYESQLKVGVDCWIEGLQFSRPSTFSGNCVLFETEGSAATFRFSHNILKAADQTNDTADWGGFQAYDAGSSIVKAWNNIAYDFNHPTSSNTQYGLFNVSVNVSGYFYNNTVINCDNGIGGYLDDIQVINNIAQDSNDGYFNWESENANTDYNISDLSSDFPGSHSQNSTTLTFADKGGDDYHLDITDTAAIGDGLDLSSTFSDDIDGDSRSSWDIGADEYGSGGGAGATPGDYLIRRNATDSTTTVTNTGNLDALWDTAVASQGSSITYSAGAFTLAAGKYLVMWSERFDTIDITDNRRVEIQGRLVIGGNPSSIGAGQTYIRKEDGTAGDWQRAAVVSGAGILDIASDDTSLVTRFYRTDNSSDAGGPVVRTADWGGVTILALDETWNYARYSLNAETITVDAFGDVVWSSTDEEETGFSRSGADITITNAGRYLVTYTIPITTDETYDRTEYVSRIRLNNTTEIEGSRVSTYIRQNQSTNDGVLSYIGIIDVGAGDVLSVEMDATDGAIASDFMESGSSIQILQLPAGNETIIVEATTGAMNPYDLTEFAWTVTPTPHIDTAAFTDTDPADSFIEVDVNDDYLFFATHATDAGTTRTFSTGRFSVNDTISNHAAGGQYNRSSGANNAGYSFGSLLTGLSAGDDISLENVYIEVDHANQTLNRGAMSGLRLGSIFPAPNASPTLNVDEPNGTGDTVTLGDSYNIQYDLADSDDEVTVAFYYDTNASGLDGTPISGACATGAEGTDVTCSWDTSGMTTGSYYVYGVADDGTNSPVSAYSSGQITIQAAASCSTVTLEGSWSSGLSHTVSAGSDRLLLFVTGFENNGDSDITGVTYGGETMTLVEEHVTTASGFVARVEIYSLDEAGIQAASGTTFNVSYASGAPAEAIHAAATFSGVDQTTPIEDTGREQSSAGYNQDVDPIEATVNVLEDGMALAGAVCGNAGSYSWGNGWSEGPDQSPSSATMSTAYHAAAADGTDTASADHSSTINRQVIVVASLKPACGGGGNASPSLNIDEPDGSGDTVAVGASYDIQYDLSDSDDTVTVAFYYDTNAGGLDGTAITGACASGVEGTDVTCTWNTTGMVPGVYFVYGITTDGTNPQVSAYSTGPIRISSGSSGGPENFSFRKKITIDHTKVGTSCTGTPLADYPVLVSISSDDELRTVANGGHVEKDNGWDIVFFDPETADYLDHEIELYEPDSGRLVAWVRVPSVSDSSDTVVYMYYGNGDITASQEDIPGVWNGDYEGVWHLKESSGTGSFILNSIQDDYHGDPDGSSTFLADAKIAGGRQVDAAIDLDNGGDLLDGDTAFTLSFWGYPNYASEAEWESSSEEMMFSADSIWGLRWARFNWMGDPQDTGWIQADVKLTSGTEYVNDSYNLLRAQWNHLVLRYDGSSIRWYINGTRVSNYTGFSGQPLISNGSCRFGNYGGTASYIDEFRYSRSGLSECSIQTDYANQMYPNKADDGANGFLTVDDEETMSDYTFAYWREITVHSARVVTGCTGEATALTDYPVLISISSDGDLRTAANSGYVQHDQGYDITFRDSDGTTPLDHEVEEYDPATGKLVAWVRVSSLSGSADTTIYMYYGNAGVISPTENPTAVWDSHYLAVYHMDRDPTGTVYDSTDNGIHLTDSGGMDAGDLNSSGQVGAGIDFDNDPAYLQSESQEITFTSFTMEAWARASSWSGWRTMVDVDDTGVDFRDFVSNDSSQPSIDDSANYPIAPAQSGSAWRHIAARYDDSLGTQRLRGFINGAISAYAPNPNWSSITGRVILGSWWYDDGSEFTDTWSGTIDEVRISDSVRSNCWIQTGYNNQVWPNTDFADPIANPDPGGGFITVGTQQSAPPTAVKLLSFTAQGEGPAVAVNWRTSFEQANLGFNLYRSESRVGSVAKLNAGLIPALGSSLTGGSYSYTDSDVTRGELYYYRLEDVDADGTYTVHGPICVDWDADGLPDDWEIAHGLDPSFNDADGDDDGDGLTNLAEYEHGTDPHNPDSDGDGIPDGQDDGRIAAGTRAGGSQALSRGVYLLDADETGMTLELVSEGFDSTLATVDGQEYEKLAIGDYVHGYTSQTGHPQLPLKGVLVDVPEGHSANISILQTEPEVHSGYRVFPVPAHVKDESDELARVSEVFSMDPQAYARNRFFPDTAAQLGESYQFRDQPKQQVIFYPLSFNPATGQLVFYKRIRVRINYVDSDLARVSAPGPTPWKPPVQDSLLESQPQLAVFAGVLGVPPAVVSPIVSALSSLGSLIGAVWAPPESEVPDSVYKLLISDEGVYRLTGSYLAAQGVAVENLDPGRVRLYNLGQEIAIDVSDQGALGVFDDADYIEFYAQPVAATHAKYTRSNVYWLTAGGGTGLPERMAAVDGTPQGGEIAQTHAYTVRWEADEDYWQTVPGPDTLDRWFSITYVMGDGIAGGGAAVDFELQLPAAAGTGTLTLALVGTYDVAHAVELSVNGEDIDSFSWNGSGIYQIVIPGLALNPLDPTHTVSLTGTSGEDLILVDFIEVTYARNFVVSGNQLKFSPDSAYRYQLTGFTSNDLLVYDISQPSDVARVVNYELSGAAGPYTLSFEPPGDFGNSLTYYVVSADQVKTPDAIVPDAASDFADTANGADYILITPADIGWESNGNARPWLTELVALREGQGLRVEAVKLEDIYDQFSYGIVGPAAIKDFLAYAYGNWQPPAPQYVLLVGDASFDPKVNYGWYAADTTAYLPGYLTYTDYQGETATDEYFACISGDDAVPDIYIGRLPASDADDAATMAARIVAYENTPNTKGWEKNVLLVADDREAGEAYDYEAVFETMNQDAAALLPAGLNYLPAGYLSQYANASYLTDYISRKLNDQLTEAERATETGGALIVNYSGHGHFQQWANEGIFANADVPALENEAMYPFVVSMSCLAGYNLYPHSWAMPSLMEELLRAEKDGILTGAAAALMPTGQTTTGGQHILNTALFETIFTADVRRLGPAIAGAKQVLLANGDVYFEQVSKTFLLFGDPAMTLKVPLPHRPTGLEATANSSGAVTLRWQPSADCNNSAVAGYRLYRSTSASGEFTPVNGQLIAGTEYVDSPGVSLAHSLTAPGYYYAVAAVDDDGLESAKSAVVSPPSLASTLSNQSSGSGGGGGGCFVTTSACSAKPDASTATVLIIGWLIIGWMTFRRCKADWNRPQGNFPSL